MTNILTRFNVFEKGDTQYSVNVIGGVGSRCFTEESSAQIAAGIYDVLLQKGNVEVNEWEMLVRATLRMINSKDAW